jgi:hypothetical protein
MGWLTSLSIASSLPTEPRPHSRLSIKDNSTADFQDQQNLFVPGPRQGVLSCVKFSLASHFDFQGKMRIERSRYNFRSNFSRVKCFPLHHQELVLLIPIFQWCLSSLDTLDRCAALGRIGSPFVSLFLHECARVYCKILTSLPFAGDHPLRYVLVLVRSVCLES